MKTGKRYNKGKNRLDLVPPELIEEVGWVLTHGAEKYAPRNWEGGFEDIKKDVYAPLLRHLIAWDKGEEFDKESGLTHLAHAGCNIAFLIALSKREDWDIIEIDADIDELIDKL